MKVASLVPSPTIKAILNNSLECGAGKNDGKLSPPLILLATACEATLLVGAKGSLVPRPSLARARDPPPCCSAVRGGATVWARDEMKVNGARFGSVPYENFSVARSSGVCAVWTR